MRSRTLVALSVLAAMCLALAAAPAAVARTSTSRTLTVTTTPDAALAARLAALQQSTRNDETQLRNDAQAISNNQVALDNGRTNTSFLLIPMSVLIGILALGGGLGVVFSIRDQHRVSQLHELSVGGEVASQRRSEQTYTFFLEESQKTLTLVNDTLALAKEATESAAHTMELKAESNLAGIEERAQALLLPLLARGQFESIFDAPEARGRLETLAGELAAIEGYRILQDIKLPPYSRFIKGMAQYLADDIAGALKTLQVASQNAAIRELQLFAVYWVAYLYDAQGQFDSAATICRSGMERLSEGRREHVEFERMIDASEFYARATAHKDSEPRERFTAVRRQLEDLQKVAREAAMSDTEHTGEVTHEVAEARGDIFMWIAYQRTRLFAPLPESAFAKARTACGADEASHGLVDINGIEKNAAWIALEDGDDLRAWAWLEAKAAYGAEHLSGAPGAGESAARVSTSSEADLKLMFGKAESRFAQADEFDRQAAAALAKQYQAVEREVSRYIGSHREQRRSAEIAHMWFVSAGRMVWLHARRGDRPAIEAAEGDLNAARRVIGDKLGDTARLGDLTLFSHLQRRAVTVSEFGEEIEEFLDQAHKWESVIVAPEETVKS